MSLSSSVPLFFPVADAEAEPTFRSVLLVEDDPLHTEICRVMLTGLGGGVTITHAPSLAAYEALCGSYDLILLDLLLPDGDGGALLPSLRGRYADAVILIISGRDDIAHAARLVGHGADDYLVKGEFNQKWLLRSLHYARQRRLYQRQVHDMQARLDSQKTMLLGYHQQVGMLAAALERSIHEASVADRQTMIWQTSTDVAQATLDMIRLLMGHLPLQPEPVAPDDLLWEACIGALGYEVAQQWEDRVGLRQSLCPPIQADRVVVVRALRFMIADLAQRGYTLPHMALSCTQVAVRIELAGTPQQALSAQDWRSITPASAADIRPEAIEAMRLHHLYAALAAWHHGSEISMSTDAPHPPVIRWEWPRVEG